MRIFIVIIALLLLSACAGQQQAEMSSGVVIDFSYTTSENSRRVRFYITVHGFDYAGHETIRQWQIESELWRNLEIGDIVRRVDGIVIRL